MNRSRTLTLLGIVAAAAASRLVPHPHNVAPMTALAVFGGATLPRRSTAMLASLGALLLSDLAFEALHAAGLGAVPGFYSGIWVVYAATALCVLVGSLIRGDLRVGPIAAATLGCSVLFFLVTNCVFLHNPLSMYPETLAGAARSYQLALPFFRNSLIGDVVYSAAMFGALAAAEGRFPSIRPASHRPPPSPEPD